MRRGYFGILNNSAETKCYWPFFSRLSFLGVWEQRDNSKSNLRRAKVPDQWLRAARRLTPFPERPTPWGVGCKRARRRQQRNWDWKENSWPVWKISLKIKRCFWEGQGDGIVSDRSGFIGNSGFSDSHRWVYFFSGSSHRWMDGLRLLVLMPPILSIELSEAVFIET